MAAVHEFCHPNRVAAPSSLAVPKKSSFLPLPNTSGSKSPRMSAKKSFSEKPAEIVVDFSMVASAEPELLAVDISFSPFAPVNAWKSGEKKREPETQYPPVVMGEKPKRVFALPGVDFEYNPAKRPAVEKPYDPRDDETPEETLERLLAEQAQELEARHGAACPLIRHLAEPPIVPEEDKMNEAQPLEHMPGYFVTVVPAPVQPVTLIPMQVMQQPQAPPQPVVVQQPMMVYKAVHPQAHLMAVVQQPAVHSHTSQRHRSAPYPQNQYAPENLPVMARSVSDPVPEAIRARKSTALLSREVVTAAHWTRERRTSDFSPISMPVAHPQLTLRNGSCGYSTGSSCNTSAAGSPPPQLSPIATPLFKVDAPVQSVPDLKLAPLTKSWPVTGATRPCGFGRAKKPVAVRAIVA